MPARVWPGLQRGLTVASTVLFLSGCAVFRRSSEPNLALGRDDLDFAKALAHYSQGLIYENQHGRGVARAHEHFEEAARLDPGQHRLQAKVADGYLLQKRVPLAVQTLRDSCERHPDSIVARIDLARAYQKAGELDQAALLLIKLEGEFVRLREYLIEHSSEYT